MAARVRGTSGPSTSATTTGSLSGVLGSDDLSLVTSGSFLDKNAGATKTVNVGLL